MAGNYSATTVTPPSETMCVVTLDAYAPVHGNESGEEPSLFGWKESDGVTENFPTDDSEKVFVGDSVSVYDEVRINPCYTWYVCTDVQYVNSL